MSAANMANTVKQVYLCFLVLLGINLSSSSRVIKPAATTQGDEKPEHQSWDSAKLGFGVGIGIGGGGAGVGIGEGSGSGSGAGFGQGSGFGRSGVGYGQGSGGSGFGQGSGFGGSGAGFGQGTGGSGFGQGSGSGGIGFGVGGGIQFGLGGGAESPSECFECRQSLRGFCCPYEEVVGEVCPSECFECLYSVSASGWCCPLEITRQLQNERATVAQKRVVVPREDAAWAPSPSATTD